MLAFLPSAASHAATPCAAPIAPRSSSCCSTASADAADCERHGARAWLRRKVVRESDLAKYGVRLEDGWEHADPAKPVVILVHGFNSTPQQNAALMVPIHDAGFPCGTFAYPNDYIIQISAQLLSSELHRFAQQYPQRRVILVCHSMGGLVARACVEDSLYDPGNVERLIMIAPPTHGTIIAHFAVGTDLWEHWLARQGRLAVAARSRFDRRWARRGGRRPLPAVGVSDRAKFSATQSARALHRVAGHGRATDANRKSLGFANRFAKAWPRFPAANRSAKELEALLADIDELVEGKGDGVVAVKRGRLDGVADTLIMPFGHLAVTGEPKSDLLRDVQHAVLERVQ